MINLIPPQLKREKKVRTIFQHILMMLFGLAIMLGIFNAALFAYNSYLLTTQHSLQKKIDESNDDLKKYKGLEAEVKSVNSKLSLIDTALGLRTDVNELFFLITKATPSTIQFKSYAFNQDKKTISLSGTADNRTDIANFKEEIEKNPVFKTVTFSTSSYNTANSKYNFTLTIEMK